MTDPTPRQGPQAATQAAGTELTPTTSPGSSSTRRSTELRSVVARLEDGGLPLEDSIALYERGVALHDHCARLLDVAELRVGRLVDGPGGAPRLVDLRPDDGDDL